MELLRSAVPVLPYQERWVRDDAQLKIVVKSRQIGYSFAASLRAVLKCLERRTTWIFLSKGERQSRELMEKVRDHCQTLKELKALPGFEEVPVAETKAMEVIFPHNRSKIIGLPANPDTARGYSGNVTLDEFAFHADAEKIYAAIYPSITRGFSLEVISTPNGQRGKFFELAKQAGITEQVSPFDAASAKESLNEAAFDFRSGSLIPPWREKGGSRFQVSELTPETRHLIPALWSGHRVTIHDAVAAGLPVDLNLLRSGVDDEETWLQEFECAFLSDAQNYIPMELIWSCVHEGATTECEREELGIGNRELYLGVDIGRKRDLTVMWLFEKVGDVMWSRTLLTLKGQTFDSQEKAFDDLMALGVRRSGIDASGLGMMLAERAQKKYGTNVEPVQFTGQVKEKLAPRVKQAFEDRLVRIPDNRDVRADLNAVKRYVTPAGNVRFDADRTERGHADRFWALALALDAASAAPPAFLAAIPASRDWYRPEARGVASQALSQLAAREASPHPSSLSPRERDGVREGAEGRGFWRNLCR